MLQWFAGSRNLRGAAELVQGAGPHAPTFRFESVADAAKLPAGKENTGNDPRGGPLNRPLTEVAP
jgi:hypothetical protein